MMKDKPTFLTPEGRRKLEEELHYLRTIRRAEIAEQIHLAKEGGDIMENSGYDEAKNAQAFVEGRIMTLEAILRNAKIIQREGATDRVELGATVTIVESNSEPETPETYMIVGSAEVDPAKGRISNESPLGKALLGHRVGDEIIVQTPSGSLRFRIIAIE